MKEVTLYYPIERTTEKAIALRVEDRLVWLPKSQIRAYKRTVNGLTQYKTIIPLWLAERNGLLAKDVSGNYRYISEFDIN